MEESLPRLRQNLASFCNRLESTCDALKLSVDRRAIPLDSASTTFIQSLNRQATSLSRDLNLLESRSLGAVSFQELLGHCNEVLNKNQSDIIQVRDRLQFLGCDTSGFDIDINEEECLAGPDILEDQDTMPGQGSILEKLEDNSLLEESMSLQKLGLSDACLASIASERKFFGHDEVDGLDSSLLVSSNHYRERSTGVWDYEKAAGDAEELNPVETLRPLISVSKDDYETLPSIMKSIVSWEELQIATGKMNVSISKKRKPEEATFFLSDELESMGLGPKVRSYVLLLVRMKRLVVETKDGSISYRAL